MSKTSIPPRHLYRHILREASYLAVSQCRKYIKQHVISQFHRHHAVQSDERKATLHLKARKFLSVLIRCNAGDLNPFNRILYLSYGRLGPRRAALVSTMMHPYPYIHSPSPRQVLATRRVSIETGPGRRLGIVDWINDCHEQDEETTKGGKAEAGTGSKSKMPSRVLKFRPPPAVQTLLLSQHKQGRLFTSVSYKIHPNGPDIPQQNSWGRSMPRSRVKNAWQKWYTKYTKRLFPPLGDEEYKGAQAVAEGSVVLTQPTRRPQGSVAVFDTIDKIQDSPANLLDNLRTKQKRPPTSREVTPRFIQRRFQALLSHIPKPYLESGQGIASPEYTPKTIKYVWQDGRDASLPVVIPTEDQANVLFG